MSTTNHTARTLLTYPLRLKSTRLPVNKDYDVRAYLRLSAHDDIGEYPISLAHLQEMANFWLETHSTSEGTKEMWSVIYGNYFPREVDSYWATKEEAEAERDKLNHEDELGSRMWEVEEITTS